MKKVLLFNPRSADFKFRIPNSVLQVAASIDGEREWVIVDGNRESDPYARIDSYLSTGEFGCVGFSVMPGPQLDQAIPFARRIRESYPAIKMVWGGYFASNQYKSVLSSGYVDVIVNGPGDYAFPALVRAFEAGTPLQEIKSLIFLEGGEIVKTPKDEIPLYDELKPLPYKKLAEFYSLEQYLGATYLGRRTLAYHSSFGCPFTCSFCAVVPIFNARWKGKSAAGIFSDIKFFKDRYGADAIEFHDNNFFVSEKRVREFSELMKNEGMIWWGEGRIDTINKFKDDTLTLMRRSGCKMIFFGAETGNDAVLKKMDKGGTQTGKQILEFAARMRSFDIIPEYSFVLGTPADSPAQVMQQIDIDIAFIKEVKRINPDTEIIIYVYSPVPTEGSEMYTRVLDSGFRFPTHLEDWLSPSWKNFDLRKNPLTPWLTPEMIDKIKNFEVVLNSRFPTKTDIRLSPLQRKIMRGMGAVRYAANLFAFPVELKALQKLWHYRQPEIQGF